MPDTKSHAPRLSRTTIAWQRPQWAQGTAVRNPGLFFISAWTSWCPISSGKQQGPTTAGGGMLGLILAIKKKNVSVVWALISNHNEIFQDITY